MPDFLLPDLGEGLSEAEVVAWHVKPGDRVVTDGQLRVTPGQRVRVMKGRSARKGSSPS